MANDNDRITPTTKVRHRKPPPAGPCRLKVLGSTAWKFTLTETNYLIGSGEECAIRLTDDPEVSRRHARLFFENDVWCLRDANSSNGIGELGPGGHETGRQLPEIRGWQHGEGVLFGRTELWMERIPTADDKLAGFHGLVGRSERMLALQAQLKRVGPRVGTVLLTGESGTGKTMIAKAIHELSGRKGEFVVVNCGALSRELAGSELYGHKKGAFSGAIADRPGAFRSADGGTLFLDEFGELTGEMQIKLLRALDQRVVKPVGDDKEYRVDARIVVATHKNLTNAVANSEMRFDLYQRVNVLPIHVPSLGDRLGDIPDLVASLCKAAKAEHVQWSKEALAHLGTRKLPGNVRELRNLVERALGNVDGTGPVLVEHFGDPVPQTPSNEGASSEATTVSIVNRTKDSIDDEVIMKAYVLNGRNVSATARVLALDLKTVRTRLAKLGVKSAVD